jgi:hypothetical protein
MSIGTKIDGAGKIKYFQKREQNCNFILYISYIVLALSSSSVSIDRRCSSIAKSPKMPST